jgi:hypothetical protein
MVSSSAPRPAAETLAFGLMFFRASELIRGRNRPALGEGGRSRQVRLRAYEYTRHVPIAVGRQAAGFIE